MLRVQLLRVQLLRVQMFKCWVLSENLFPRKKPWKGAISITVGETHGKMKWERTALKGLNFNTLNIQPFQGWIDAAVFSHRFHWWLLRFHPFRITKLLFGVDSMFYCSNVQMFYCSNLLLFYCSIVQISYCSNALLFYYSIVLLFYCSIILLFYCSIILLFYYSIVLLFYCSIILLFYYSIIQMSYYSNARLFKCLVFELLKSHHWHPATHCGLFTFLLHWK